MLRSEKETEPLGTLLMKSQTSGSKWDLNQEAESNLTTNALSIVVIGASGDLAVKKTFPALFSLYCNNLLPPHFVIFGFARSHMELDAFRAKVSSKFNKEWNEKKEEFLANVFYHSGQYDSAEDFHKMSEELSKQEQVVSSTKMSNRVFYFAIPPNVFVSTARSIHSAALTKTGWNRIIVEKPFGRDSESSAELGRDLGQLFTEREIFRIDHYLGKEMVQNLMVLRFSNRVFEPIWNRNYIGSVQITFKENFGTQGRGGYFDHYGIIRDVMQNHLMQMMSLVCMDTPVSLSSEDVRDEKVKLLRCIRPIRREDIVIGQYEADPNGSEGSYLDDPTVPNDSLTPTYACAVLWVDNERWAGIPFILKCGKALSERKADIRIQFKVPANRLFDDMSPNEIVLRVQPDEAVYLKMTTKEPGLFGGSRHTELDLSYKQRFGEKAKALPDAYERLILDVLRGDHNLFVRADELRAAWEIFTPILHELDSQKVKPLPYAYGSRGPKEADELIARVGYIRTDKYHWQAPEDVAKGGKSKL